MSATQEEIEAAVELWKQFRERNTIDVFAVIHPDVVGVRWAMADKLADAYLTERAERQRRIEAAAAAIEAARAELDCVASPEARKAAIVRIITSHLDGETP